MKIIITECQYNLLENLDKNKKFLIKTMNYDFTGKIEKVNSVYDVPMKFDDGIGSNLIRRILNFHGPMYLVNVYGKDYLYKDYNEYEWFCNEDGFDFVDDEINEELGISVLGLRFSDIIDIFYNK